MSLHNDESGVSVIIGTMMLILITITAASGLALMVSGMQKEAMERESHLAAVESENLRIIAIESVENSTDFTQWDSVNVTIMNLNTADSRITAISLNGKHASNYLAKDASGDLDYYKRYPSYPVVYNFNKRVIIPAAGSKEICLNFSGIVVGNTSEVIDVSGWTYNGTNYTFPLSNHPRVAYPDVDYFEEFCNNTNYVFDNTTDYNMNKITGVITPISNSNMGIFQSEIIDVSNWTDNAMDYPYPLAHSHIENGSENVSNLSTSFIPANNYTMDYPAGNIILFGGGNMSNTSNYTINYTTYNTGYSINYTTRFDTFPSPFPVSKNEHITIEVITSLINIFKRTFMPPVPLAEVQIRSEWLSFNKTRDYLILDASESFDTDGSIVEYNWSIYKYGGCSESGLNPTNATDETFNCTTCGNTTNLSCTTNPNFYKIVNNTFLTVWNVTRMEFGTNELNNTNYTIDAQNGNITCNCGGNMSNNTNYSINYTYTYSKNVTDETFNCTTCGNITNLNCTDPNFYEIVNNTFLTVWNVTRMEFGTNELNNANYTIDAQSGTITCNCSGNMSNNTNYSINYTYTYNYTDSYPCDWNFLWSQTGLKVRANIANSTDPNHFEVGPFYIDLNVTDDTGMTANLGRQSGKIYIPKNQNFNNP